MDPRRSPSSDHLPREIVRLPPRFHREEEGGRGGGGGGEKKRRKKKGKKGR